MSRIETISDGRVNFDRVRYLCKPKDDFRFQYGDILFSHINSVEHIGKTAFFDSDRALYHGMNLLCVRPDEDKIDPQFLHYVLTSEEARNHARRECKPAINQASLGQKDISRFRFHCPSRNEQRRIAEILSTLDDTIEQTKALIAKYQQIKAGLMHDLFTRGVTPGGKLRPTRHEAPQLNKESPLGWIPKEWAIKAVKELGKVSGGKRVPAGTPFAGQPTPYPYLRVTDMVDGWIDDNALEYVDPATEQLISSYKIFRDDIYVTIAGTLGQFGRIPEHLSGAQLTENAARITETDQKVVDLDFLCSALRSDLLADQKFAAIGVGAGVPKLALYQIERFLVPIPPLEEQRDIQKPLNAIRQILLASGETLKKLRQQKHGLMHDLLTGRVRVKVAA